MSTESIESLIKAEAEKIVKEKGVVVDLDNLRESDYPYWEVGESYHIETVKKYYTGLLVDITETDFVLTQACWISSTGFFADYCKGAAPRYAERYLPESLVLVSRGGYLSAVKRNLVIETIR